MSNFRSQILGMEISPRTIWTTLLKMEEGEKIITTVPEPIWKPVFQFFMSYQIKNSFISCDRVQ